jgi:hypothetical protein
VLMNPPHNSIAAPNAATPGVTMHKSLISFGILHIYFDINC